MLLLFVCEVCGILTLQPEAEHTFLLLKGEVWINRMPGKSQVHWFLYDAFPIVSVNTYTYTLTHFVFDFNGFVILFPSLIYVVHKIFPFLARIHLAGGLWKWEPWAAAAAAKPLQSCPALCNPIDDSPSGSPVPGILQARTLEWVAIFFSNAWKWKVKVKSLSHVQLFATPLTAAYQVPSSMGFSRQEYWSGMPLPSPWSLGNHH